MHKTDIAMAMPPPTFPSSSTNYTFNGNTTTTLLVCFGTVLFLRTIYTFLTQRNKVIISWPLVGALPRILLNINHILDWATDILRKTGGTQIVSLGDSCFGNILLVTCDPQNLEYMLRTNFDNFPHGEDCNKMLDVLGNGIINSDGEPWRKQRKIATTLFHSKHFRNFVSHNARELTRTKLIPVLRQFANSDKVFDLQNLLLRFTFDNIFKNVFGTELGCLGEDFSEHPFGKSMDNLTEVILYRHVMPRWLRHFMRRFNLGIEKTAKESSAIARQFVHQCINLKREQLRKSSSSPPRGEVEEAGDLLARYMIQFPEHQEDPTFLSDTCFNVIAGGRDTTGTALSWFFWLVSRNPKVKTKIRNELKALLVNHNRNHVEAGDLHDMVYLHAAIYETLRLYPTVPLDHREVIKEDKLPDGTLVKPGMTIIYSIYSVGRMEWVWGKDCMEFRPERWIDQDGKLKHENNSFRFMAFNGGPRTCLGKDLAIVTMKFVAAEVLLNFDLEVMDDEGISPRVSMILSMKNGLLVRLKERPN